MIRYKSVILTIPAQAENKQTILTVGEGKKITLKALGRSEIANVTSVLTIGGDVIADVDSTLKINDTNFLPINAEITGPVDIKVGGKNRTDGDEVMVLCIAYEEMKE